MWRLPPASNEFKSIFIVSDFLRILMAFFIVKNMLLLVELNVEMKGKIGLPIRYFRACKNSVGIVLAFLIATFIIIHLSYFWFLKTVVNSTKVARVVKLKLAFTD